MDKYKKDMRDMKKNLADAISIWNHAIISLIDIRHSLISPEESIHGYRLPTSTFLYTIGSKAEVVLNDTSYSVVRFGLFHGGKGTELSIQPADNWLEYYMIHYKVGMPPFHKREYTELLEKINPFRQQYGFTPDNPLFFAEQLRKMYELWKGSTPLNLFYGKTAFYQLVYEIYEEMDQGNVEVLEPDVVAMAKRYLDEHYHKTISIQSIASLLGISDSHLRRCFKSQYGESPQEYLMKTRLYSAKKLLQNRDSTIRQVAAATGFSDEFNFSRSFMKSFGISPKQYRAKTSNNMSDYIMDFDTSFSYNDNREVSLFKLKEEGANFMIKQIKSKAIVAVALSLMLMLSACGTTSTNAGNTEPTQVTETEAQNMETGTRIVSTVMGDVEVPVNPKRIYADYNVSVGDLISFGTQLIAHGAYGYDYVASDEDIDTGLSYKNEITDIDYVEGSDFEGIMSHNPDLIITHNPDTYAAMSEIAPTVFIAWDMELQERITLLGEVLNEQTEAEDLLAQFNQKIDNAKSQLEQTGILNKTISIFDGNLSYLYVYGDNYGRGGPILYQYWGFKAPEIIQNEMIGKEEDAQWRNISLEVLNQFCGDYIVFAGDTSVFEGNQIWDSLPAVQNGNVIEVDEYLFYSQDLHSLNAQADYLLQVLLKAGN